MKKIYRQIARRYNISTDEVRKDMKDAIDAAYINPNFNARCIPCKGAKPTVDEFIEYMAKRIKEQL